MSSQEQFLEVVDRDEAERRFRGALDLRPLGVEEVALDDALGRVLAQDVLSPVDVPAFDRSNFDGFAVRAASTYEAREERPRRLRLLGGELTTGQTAEVAIGEGEALAIATGAMLPRGADAVVMIEHTEATSGELLVRKAVTPGFGVAFAGTDIAAGETVLRQGDLLTSRETGVLAAMGVARVGVWRAPLVAILSTGDELIAPGEPMRPAMVYDSNARILADAVRELGCEPLMLGIVPDEPAVLRDQLQQAMAAADAVLLSGGTSKGGGDISYRAVAELRSPGIVAHGVALKPGKPICLAVECGKPVVVLPGFPTSAIFTFHEFVAPVLRTFAGRRPELRASQTARLAMKINSEVGRTEYVLVGLVDSEQGLTAWPMGKGSGSVTAFSRADGFVTIGRHEEQLPAGATVSVQLLGTGLELADLVVIGSHCVGLDYLLSRLQELGFRTKFLAVGSTAGLQAAARGECDLAGIHLFDSASGEYNRPFLSPGLKLVEGYGRLQGVVFRAGDTRFEGRTAADAVAQVRDDPHCVMVNRNQGSGTRILIDRLLVGAQPAGHPVAAKNHNAVAAAIAQGRADWGVAIQHVAEHQRLGFLPLQAEQYDFVIPESRWSRPAVAAFRKLLRQPDTVLRLATLGLKPPTASPP